MRSIKARLKRILALTAIAVMLLLQVVPIFSYAISQAPPDEKAVAKTGRWQMDSYRNMESGQNKFYSMYTGDIERDDKKAPTQFAFSLNSDTKLSRIHVVHKRVEGPAIESKTTNNQKTGMPADGDVLVSYDTGETGPNAGVNDFSKVYISIIGKDKRYGPYDAKLDMARIESEKTPSISVATVSFDSSVVLESGKYTLEVSNLGATIYNGDTDYMPATLIIGVNNEAWENYEKRKVAQKIEEDEKQQANEKDQSKDGKDSVLDIDKMIEIGKVMVSVEEDQEKDAKKAQDDKNKQTGFQPSFKAAEFELTADAYIDAIQTEHFNAGKGAAPGVIQLKDKNNQIVGTWYAKGNKLNDVQNAVWTVSPDIVVPAGKYTVIDSDTSSLSYDLVSMEPVFYVRAIDPPMYDFTGTYMINVKTACVSSMNKSKIGTPSKFDRDGFEIAVIDRGNAMEIIGRYTQEKKKDMFFPTKTTEYDFKDVPFSQLCEVVTRDRTKATVKFKFNIDLKNLPYMAAVGTEVLLSFDSKDNNPTLVGNGGASYTRLGGESYGTDVNAYSVSATGNRQSVQMPYYVQEQVAKIARMGNVPGPETPERGAAGVLFPPLAGLILQIALTMKKPKIIKPDPDEDSGSSTGFGSDDDDGGGSSDSGGDSEEDSGDSGEEDSSDSGGEDGGSGDESGESNEEQTSDVGSGDSNSDGTGDFVNGQKSDLESERDEWVKNLKDSMSSADPSDPNSQALHKQYQDYIDSLNEKINGINSPTNSGGSSEAGTMTVQVDHTGRTAEISYDPATGNWINTESGNIFDMNRYEKDVLPNFEKDRAFIEQQRKNLETRNTPFDKAMDKMVADNKERARLLTQIQRVRDGSYGIEPIGDGVGDVQGNIKKLMEDLNNRDIPIEDLRDKASRITKVVTGRNTGRTAGFEEIEKVQSEDTFTNHAISTLAEGTMDITTGRTWAGMAGRMVLGAVTGGMSEIPLTVGETMVNIRDSINQGDDGITAVAKGFGMLAIGELGGEYLGAAWNKTGLHVNPDLIKRATEIGSTPVSKLANQLIGGSARGTKDAIENLATSSGKRLIGSADGTLTKDLVEQAKYGNYKVDVDSQVDALKKAYAKNGDLSCDEIRKVLQDPTMGRTIKDGNVNFQNRYQDALENKIYKPAYENTSNRLMKDLNADESFLKKIEMEHGAGATIEKVNVDTIRTPGVKSSRINADNDIAGVISIKKADGTVVQMEIPSGKSSNVYNEEFASACGVGKSVDTGNGTSLELDIDKVKKEYGSTVELVDVSGNKRVVNWEDLSKKEQLDVFAKKHNQEVTDVLSNEAAKDFNKYGKASGMSNVQEVMGGFKGAKLDDPGGLANMEKYKINNYFNKGDIPNQTEAFEQLNKMGKLTNNLTDAYKKLGYTPNAMPDNMQKALDIVGNRNMSPGTRVSELQKLGFESPAELADKFSSRIEGLQKLGSPKVPSQTDDKVLQKVIAMVTRTHLEGK